MLYTFGNISFKLVLLTPGAKPHINSLFERIFGDISSCKACSCADWRKSTWSGLICWAPCPQIWPSVTCSCSPGWCVVGNDPRSFKKKIIFTSPTKSTMSSLPLNCVVASFPLAALHSSELPNSTKAYLEMWMRDSFRKIMKKWPSPDIIGGFDCFPWCSHKFDIGVKCFDFISWKGIIICRFWIFWTENTIAVLWFLGEKSKSD